jgi:hypothetical protein
MFDRFAIFRAPKKCMVSVVVSIRMHKMFGKVRKMFSNARDAEQDVREGQASTNF